MKTLFISTYDEILTIALLSNDNLISLKERTSGRSHSENLLPMIDETLTENDILPTDLTEIIVINGPGSFTGIRLGITVAKTLGYTLNIPIKLISALEALAISDSNLTKKIIRINDPKGVYYGMFENNTLIGELNYLSNADFKVFLEDNSDLVIPGDTKLDVEAINRSLKEKAAINPHEVKAVYIKQIEVMNGS